MASLTASLAGGEEAAISQLKTSSEGLQDDEQLLQTTALELYALACEAGDAAAVAGAVENLLQDSPEQGRVLRRLLLATANVQFETAPGKRSAICNLLCELYLCDVIPETVVCDCLEQLLWNIQDPSPDDIECACSVLQSCGPLLDASDLDAADELMEDLFARLKQLAASNVLPDEQQHLVRAVVRQRAAGWPSTEVPEGVPGVLLTQKTSASGSGEDWRAVLDSKAGQAKADRPDSPSGSGGAETESRAAEGIGSGEGPQQAPLPEAGHEQQQQSGVVQRLLEQAGPGDAPWNVPVMIQQLREQTASDWAAAGGAEQVTAALLSHAANSALSAGGEGHVLSDVPPAIEGCVWLLAELQLHVPATSAAAAACLAAALKQRSEARSPAARQLLGLQMLLAGLAAQRGVVPEQQLHAMLEQLARQVMKPSPSDVVCLTFLLRGAGPAADAKKSQWWKAVSQLATSPNVSADQQRELEHLLLLREHRWVNATAAAAATESDVRRKVERTQAELAEATRLRAAQEEAAAAAAAELQKAEERTKAAAAQLAELQQGAVEAQASADAAARRRAEDERAAATARKQAQEALAEAARTKQAADTHAAMGSSSADSDSGSGTASEAGRLWYCANAVDGAGPWGPHTAAELLGWLYQDVTLAGELQVIRAGEATWVLMEERLGELQADMPPMPHRQAQQAAPSGASVLRVAVGKAGRAGGRGAGRGPPAGRGGGRGGRGGGGFSSSSPVDFPSQYSPAAVAPGLGRGRGRGGARFEAGRGAAGRGRGRESYVVHQPVHASCPPAQHGYAQPAQPAVQAVQPQRAPSPPRYEEDVLPHLFSNEQPAQPQYTAPAAAPAGPAGGAPAATHSAYNPLRHSQAQAAQPGGGSGASAAAPRTTTGLCPSCGGRESGHVWLPCGHPGHCTDCLPDYLSPDEKLANCPTCMICQQRATHYLRVFA